MSKKTIEQQLSELDARRQTLIARQKKQNRTQDTRRKILIGALVLHQLKDEKNPKFAKGLQQWLRRDLPGYLTRKNDLALFTELLDQKSSTEADPNPGS